MISPYYNVSYGASCLERQFKTLAEVKAYISENRSFAELHSLKPYVTYCVVHTRHITLDD